MRTTYPDDAPTVGLLAHGHRSRASAAMRRLSCDRIGAFALLSNFARNSPANVSRYELKVLKLQRFRALLKVHSIELRATLGE